MDYFTHSILLMTHHSFDTGLKRNIHNSFTQNFLKLQHPVFISFGVLLEQRKRNQQGEKLFTTLNTKIGVTCGALDQMPKICKIYIFVLSRIMHNGNLPFCICYSYIFRCYSISRFCSVSQAVSHTLVSLEQVGGKF